MAYPQRLLTDGERVVLDLHPSWRRIALPLALVPIVVGATSYGIAAIPHGRYQSDLRWAVLAAGLLVLLAASGRPYLRWVSTRYVVTTHRVLVRGGVLRRQGRDIPMTRISDVSFSTTLVERILRAGTLVIESAGEHGRVTIVDVPGVEKVQRTVYQLAEDAGARGLQAGGASQTGGV